MQLHHLGVQCQDTMLTAHLHVLLHVCLTWPGVAVMVAFFQDVLRDEVGPPFLLASFRAFATKQLMEENVDFWLQVRLWHCFCSLLGTNVSKSLLEVDETLVFRGGPERALIGTTSSYRRASVWLQTSIDTGLL